MARLIRELLEAVLLALLVFFVIRISIQNFRVEGHSMQPTLQGGEYLMVNKLAYFSIDMQRLARLVPFWDVEEAEERYPFFAHPPERGDVVVFHAPPRQERDFVKRVVGLPGERVQIKEGTVFIDGVELDEPYLSDIDLSGSMDCIPKLSSLGCSLPEGQYFVLGDNRNSSNDSRDWGPAPLENMVGKVWFIYWPLPKLPLPFVERLDKLR